MVLLYKTLYFLIIMCKIILEKFYFDLIDYFGFLGKGFVMPRRKEIIKTSFTQHSGVTLGILRLMSDITKNSIIPFKERREKGKKLAEILKKATEKTKQ